MTDRIETIGPLAAGQLTIGWPQPKPTDVAIVIAGPDRERLVEIQWNGVVRYGPDVDLDEVSRRFWEAVGRGAPCRGESP